MSTYSIEDYTIIKHVMARSRIRDRWSLGRPTTPSRGCATRFGGGGHPSTRHLPQYRDMPLLVEALRMHGWH